MGYPDIPSTLLLYVAQDAKLFAAEHLRVEARVYATGREALAAALSGETDAAVVYSTPVVIAALSGEDVVVLTTLHRADGLTGLAVAPGTSSQLALDVLLAEGGLDARDIQVVAAQPKDLIDALADRRIDAASLWVPNLLSVTGPGKAQLLTSDVYSEMSMLAGVRPRIEARRTEATRFLRALLRAQALIRRRPAVVESALRPRFPQLTPDELQTILSHSRFELGMSNLLLTSLRQEAAWLEQRGERREGQVRFRDVLTPDLLEELAPESVTLLTAAERALR